MTNPESPATARGSVEVVIGEDVDGIFVLRGARFIYHQCCDCGCRHIFRFEWPRSGGVEIKPEREDEYMKYYWDVFIDELITGKIEDFRAVEGAGMKEPFVARIEELAARDLCRLFYDWLDKRQLVK